MKSHNWYLVIIAITLFAVTLQITGGYTELVHAMHAAKPGQFIWFGGIRSFSVAVLSLIAWIIGLVLTFRDRQWKWFICILLTSYLGALIYSIVRLFQHMQIA